jgi:hypothetical protein
LGVRVVRIITVPLCRVTDVNSAIAGVDFNVVIASVFSKAAYLFREFGKIEKAWDFVKIEAKEIFTASSLLQMIDRMDYAKLDAALHHGDKMIDAVSVHEIFGKCPDELVRCVVPIGWKLELDGSIVGPYLMVGATFFKGGFYVKVSRTKAVVMLTGDENVEQWIESLDAEPLKSALAKLCSGEGILECLVPGRSDDHPIYMRLQARLSIR